MSIPDPSEFFDLALQNALAQVDLTATVSGLALQTAERKAAEIGASAGITAAVDELHRRGMIVEASS